MPFFESNMMDAQSLAILVPALLLIQAGVSFLISRFGWSSFADKHGTDEKPDEKETLAWNVRFSSLFSNYRQGVFITPMAKGLFFRPTFLFRIAHRPFIVPWKNVVNVEEKRQLFLIKFCEITIEDSCGTIRVMTNPAFSSKISPFISTSSRKYRSVVDD